MSCSLIFDMENPNVAYFLSLASTLHVLFSLCDALNSPELQADQNTFPLASYQRYLFPFLQLLRQQAFRVSNQFSNSPPY